MKTKILIVFLSCTSLTLSGQISQNALNSKYLIDSLEYMKANFSSRPDKVKNYAEDLLEFAINEGIDTLSCQAKLLLAYTNYFTGNYGASNFYYHELMKSPGCTTMDSASIYNNIGVNYEFLGKYDAAIEAYLSSVSIEAARNNDQGKYLSWINIGVVAIKNNDFRTAIDYLNEASSFFLQQQDSNRMALCYQNKGIAFINLAKKDSAKYYIQKALQIYEQRDELPGQFEVLYNAGKNYALFEKDPKATLASIQQADEVLSQLPAGLKSRYEPYLAYLKGDYYLNQGAYKEAKLWYNNILDYWKALGGKEYRDLLINLSQIYGYEGNIPAMEVTIKEWSAITDSIYQASASNQLAALRVNYEVDALQQNLALEKLKRKALLVSSRLRLAGLFLTLALAVALYVRYREQKKLNRTLFLLNQENIRGRRQVAQNEETSLQDRYDELIRLIEEEQLFLDPNLDRDTIIQKLNTNSAYFNELIKCSQYPNFSWLINAYRINHAKLRLIEGNYENTTEVYQEAGFNNRATWNRVFKQHTGMTPSTFIEQLKEANKNS